MFYSKLRAFHIFQRFATLQPIIVDCLKDKLSDITKTSPCNEDPLTPHFNIVKLGFTGIYIIFLFLLLNIDCGYSLEPPQ